MATLLCHRRKSYAQDAAGLFCRLLGEGRHLSKHPLTLLLSDIKRHRSNIFQMKFSTCKVNETDRSPMNGLARLQLTWVQTHLRHLDQVERVALIHEFSKKCWQPLGFNWTRSCGDEWGDTLCDVTGAHVPFIIVLLVPLKFIRKGSGKGSCANTKFNGLLTEWNFFSFSFFFFKVEVHSSDDIPLTRTIHTRVIGNSLTGTRETETVLLTRQSIHFNENVRASSNLNVYNFPGAASMSLYRLPVIGSAENFWIFHSLKHTARGRRHRLFHILSLRSDAFNSPKIEWMKINFNFPLKSLETICWLHSFWNETSFHSFFSLHLSPHGGRNVINAVTRRPPTGTVSFHFLGRHKQTVGRTICQPRPLYNSHGALYRWSY